LTVAWYGLLLWAGQSRSSWLINPVVARKNSEVGIARPVWRDVTTAIRKHAQMALKGLLLVQSWFYRHAPSGEFSLLNAQVWASLQDVLHSHWFSDLQCCMGAKGINTLFPFQFCKFLTKQSPYACNEGMTVPYKHCRYCCDTDSCNKGWPSPQFNRKCLSPYACNEGMTVPYISIVDTVVTLTVVTRDGQVHSLTVSVCAL